MRCALRKALDFIGAREVEDSFVSSAVEFSRFENIKKLEREGRINSKKMKPRNPDDEETYKVRKGKIGGYSEYLNKEDLKFAEDLIAEMGCPFYTAEELAPGYWAAKDKNKS